MASRLPVVIGGEATEPPKRRMGVAAGNEGGLDSNALGRSGVETGFASRC